MNARMNARWNAPAVSGRLRRAWSAAGTDARGVALITTLYVVFALGMMLFAFTFMNQSEVGFAAFNRNETLALGLAEAGMQEAINRLNISGGTPGTCFWNSLTGTSATPPTCAPLQANAVGYQLALQNNPMVFPILSVATYGGTQRAVRIFVQATFKTGFGDIVFGPQVIYQGNAMTFTGDSYSQLSLKFQTYAKSPPPAATATPTNLVAPQAFAGGQLQIQGGGPGPYPFECGSTAASSTGGPIQLTEVAPTPCPGGRAVVGGTTAPVNWHPITPVGMTKGDFDAVMRVWNGNQTNLDAILGAGQVQVFQATQNNAGVTYSPVSSAPPYMSLVAGTVNKVYVITNTSTAGFCVQAASPPGCTSGCTTPPAVAAPTGTPPSCSGGYNGYGNVGFVSGLTLRYIDWALVSDDLKRAVATTFYQPPPCSTCSGGFQGIRYIPLLPTIPVMQYACTNNLSPGFNVLDAVVASPVCANPPTQTINSTNITITGTKANPEFIVINNAGGGTVQMHFQGSATGCTDTFASASWGVILATGDIDILGGAFNGLIYTPGTIFTHGNPVVAGGFFSATPPGSTVNSIDQLGTLTYCGGITTTPLVPQFFTFGTVTGTWQDRPANQP